MSIYLDHNATARVRPEAIAAMAAVMQAVGNPSSIHAAGRAARAVMEQARTDVAALIAAPASTVIFLSGGPRPMPWRWKAPSRPGPGA